MAKIFFLIIFIFSSCIYSQTFYIDHDIKQISITSDGQFHTVHYNGKLDLSSLDKVEGQPQLPVYLYKISLNENESIESFRIDKIKEQKLDGKYNIKIQQPLWRQDLEEKLPITGKTDQINFPQQLIEYTGTSSFNGYPIAHFAVHPFRYERDTGNLYFIEQIQFTINSGQVRSGSVKPNEKFRSGNEKLLSLAKSGQVNKISALSEAASGWSVDDSGIPLRYYSAGLVDRYIIITTEELAPAFASLAEWKTKKGVPTIIRTLDWIRSNFPDGLDDADCIRNYIRWSYKNRGTKYIMLGGDTELIPSRIITTGGFTFPADYYFADLDGNWNADQDDTFGEAVDHLDGYPEVYVSRIPVQTQVQVSRFVSRLFQYEKLINIDNPDFPANVLYMAANLNKENDSRDLIMNYIDPQINGDFQRTLLTQSVDIGNDPAPALNALNNSPAIIFTENHGLYHTIRTGGRGSNIYVYQVGRLTNHDPGIWYVASCYTNDIVKRSFSEMYLLAENGGGVAYIGNSSYEYPFSGIQLQKEFFKLAFSEGKYHLSEAHYLSRLPFLGYLSWEGPSRIIVYSTIVLGDAEMPVWTAKPDSFLVEQQQIDSEQGKFLSLTVSRAGDSSPVQDALVTLYRKDEIYELQMTDASGQARFDINNIEAGTVDITITKHNYKPYEDSTEFGTDADPRLDLSSVTFTDVDGNGNNWCEPGEELNMHLSITNIGENGIPAGMEALLTGEENLIVLDTSQISISDSIAPGQTLELPQIPFYVNNDIRSDTTLVKRIHFISAGKSIGMLPVIFSVNLPNLMIVEPEISTEQEDTVFNSAVYLNIENSGNGGARAIQVKMQSGQKGVDITDSVFVFGNIDAGQRTQTSADFSINHTIPVDSLSLKIIISDYYGHTQNAKIDFRQPIAPSSFSFKPQMESIELNWSQSLSSDILGYQLFRKSPGDAEFYKITDQLISKAGYYVDKNVSEGETYQYLVRAVDSSYNISSFYRDTISAWPSVKLKPGFPIDNGEKAIGADNNGLAVYDFDGDDKQDIVVSGGHGVLKIYNNEGELQHSFENLSGYTNKPAIGNVFGDTRMEVVQSTYGRGTENNYIYIINPVNGQVIESIWLNYNEPSPIVLKDIDQDGYDDIITLTHGNASPVKPRGSRLMIWRSTGAGWETFPGWPEQGYYFDETTSLGMPAAADMTGDGIIDIIVTTCNIDSVSKVDGTIYSKSKIYSFEPAVSDSAAWIKLYYEMLNSPVSLADIDRDGKLEILIVSIYHDKIYTLNHRGEEFPGWQSGIKVGAANPWYIGSPAIPANLDPADPQLEIAYAGRDSLYVFQHSGEKMANWPIAIHNGDNFFDEQHGKISVNSSPVIADLDQDGIYEIICVTNDGLIHAFNAKTTKEIPGFPVNSYNDEIRSESPLVSDVDHDGDLDLLYADHSGKLFFWDVNIPYTNGSLLCWSQPFSNFRHTGELDSLKLGPLSSVRHADANRTPDLYYLRHNYPNPFNPSTTIEFGLNNPAIVKLTIFNLLGQEIISLTDGAYSTGKHQIRWNGRNKNGVYVSSGIYIYRLLVKEPQTGKTLFHKQHKMILLK